MKKIESITDFYLLRDHIISDRPEGLSTLIIPAGTCGQASGANDLIRVAKKVILEKKLIDHIRLRITGCHGFCQMEPSILIEPRNTFYPKVDLGQVPLIIEAAINNEIIPQLLWTDSETGEKIERQQDIPFFRHQSRTLLASNEKVDPIRIHNYIENGGYQTLAGLLEKGKPDAVIKEIKSSGLRGRGGAGFPAGLKWELMAKKPKGNGKFLICNADEGDPGAYMDRSLLEGNPHSIVEGMLIGAFATGADKGIIYVRSEYPLAIKHLMIALRQARDLGILGQRVLGTGFSFDISLVKGAGAFVCGEETALIKSVEGKPGEPEQRPPFPIDKGINGNPTLINNVETWANVPVILAKGAKAFTRIGTPNNTGTKIFSLVGKIKYTGLVEIPMGMTLRQILFDIGGGQIDNREIKAVQTGGPSGGCIPEKLFDLPMDYDSLAEVGSIMGSGGMIVMDDHSCMVDVAKYFMNFLKDESCGKCFSCRKGTQRMYELLDDISRGEGTVEKLKLLEELALVVKDTTLCGLGQTAANPVLSTLRYFRDEYLEHIEARKCRGKVCKDLITYRITENCTGCLLCIKACPEKAISGKKKELHQLDESKCIKCGACLSVCKDNAVIII
ncbi:4Fe-4S binding protein [bacterium]|nr:4Fe-4S binding protein [bacterium]